MTPTPREGPWLRVRVDRGLEADAGGLLMRSMYIGCRLRWTPGFGAVPPLVCN